MCSCPISFAICFALLWILCVGQPCVAPLVCKDGGEHKGACPSSGIACAGRVLTPSVRGKTADALVTEVSKGKGKVFSSHCPLWRYFAWLSHEKLPLCPRLFLTNTCKLLLRWALDSAGCGMLGTNSQPSRDPKSKARAVGRGWTAAPAHQQVLMLLEVCAAWQAFSSSGSGGVPARNELWNFEMLIRQQSLASEPFPRGSYSAAIYSWNCKS